MTGADGFYPTMPETILVFDSGLGGTTVLREIVKLRPGARYIYTADDAYFPYGQHTEAHIIARVVPLIGEVIAAHAPDLVVIACNTASTLVMDHLRKTYDVPFVGTVPAIKPACASSRTKRVSVLGTKGTVQREYTKKLIADFAQGCEVTLIGAENLASLAEAAMKGETVGDDAIAAEIAPVLSMLKRQRRSHRYRGAGLHALSAADGPADGAGAVAGGLDRSGAGDCASGERSSRQHATTTSHVRRNLSLRQGRSLRRFL